MSGPAAVTAPSDVAAAIVPGRSVGYAPVFYPGTTIQAEAGQVTVGPGQELNGVDMSMRLVPTAKIEGTVMGADGRPAANSMVTALPSDTAAMVGSRAVSTGQDGKFSLTNVAPGRYTLMARGGGMGVPRIVGEGMVFMAAPPGAGPPPGMPPPPPPPPPPPGAGALLFAEQPLDVSGEDIAGLALTLQTGMTVSGRVVFDGKTTTPPADLKQIRVFLTHANPNRMTIGIPGAPLTDTGTFTIEGVPPGQDRFSTTMAPPGATGSGWTLKSAIVEGRDALDTPLEIRPGMTTEGVTLTYTDLISEISGTLSDGKGKPISDLSILVFTTDRLQWGPSSRRLRAPTQPASDGKFRIPGLPAGEVYLGAVTDLEPGRMAGPRLPRVKRAAAAIKVTIADGEKKVQDIKLAGGNGDLVI